MSLGEQIAAANKKVLDIMLSAQLALVRSARRERSSRT